MKRVLIVLLAMILCLVAFSGCDKSDETPTQSVGNQLNDENPEEKEPVKTDSHDFSAHLDMCGFKPGLSQGKLLDLMESYTYKGKSVRELAPALNYDGENGGGCSGWADDFGFTNDYYVPDNGTHATYYNRFVTSVPLEGHNLPYGIAFSDNMVKAFEKIGIGKKPYTNFVADEGRPGIMTISKDEKATLELIDGKLLPVGEKTLYKYHLRYTEKYKTTLAGREEDVMRCIQMSYADEKSELKRFEIFISELYEVS